MGSSFIEFNNYGFWAKDSSIEVWLYLLVIEIDKIEDLPDWLKKTREQWLIDATAGFIGCISPNLDKYLTNYDKVLLVIKLSGDVLKWLSQQKSLSYKYLNSLGVGGIWWTRDIKAEVFIQIGRKFIELLKGELNTAATTLLIY